MLTEERLKEVKERIGAADLDGLIAALKEEDWKTRQEACFALGRFGAPAVEPLIGVLQDAEAGEYARGHAMLALAEIGDARAVAPLQAALEDEAWLVRGYALRAMGSFPSQGEEAVAAYIRAYERDDNEKCTVRNSAAALLAKEGGGAALEFLRGMAENDPDPGVRATARRGVSAIEGG